MKIGATRLVWGLVIVVIAAPLLFFAGIAKISYDQHFRDARIDALRTLGVVREHANRVFETHHLIARYVDLLLRGMTDIEIRANEARLNVELKTLVDRYPQVQDIWVVDRDGRPLVTGNVFPLPADIDLSDRNYYRVFRDGRLEPSDTYVSEALHGRVQNVNFFQVTRARTGGPGNAFEGVDVVSVEPRYFAQFFQSLAEPPVESLTLVRDDGAILARYPPLPGRIDQWPRAIGFPDQIEREPGGGIYDGISAFDGVERITAYQQLPGLPVYVLAGVNRAQLVDQWRATMLRYLAFGIPAMAALWVMALLTLLFTRRESAALKRLRTEAERRESAEGQLRQAQKMEAVGRLTGGVAHDFNNLLTIVLGNLDLLKRRLTNSEERVQKAIESALTGATRAAALTQRLLAFSRQEPLAPAAVDVNKLVANMSDLLRRSLGETIAVETVLAGGLWRAHVDANQLESALLNLAVNARDAMPEGGKLTIESANAYLDDAYAAARPDVKPGQYVMIGVADTGTGMAPSVAAQAFEPFFTTKPVGQGTGLGLSQVYGFVKQSNGHVSIYSEINHGTAVKLYLPKLPKSEEQKAFEPMPVKSTPQSPGQGTILVVEDDDMVRELSVDALEDAGYTVIQCEDARRGLAFLSSHPEIEMLFTDVVLTGGMNGRQLADEGAKMRPALKILFTTGYTQNAIVHHGRLDEGINFIGKPFTAAALVAKMQAVLKG